VHVLLHAADGEGEFISDFFVGLSLADQGDQLPFAGRKGGPKRVNRRRAPGKFGRWWVGKRMPTVRAAGRSFGKLRRVHIIRPRRSRFGGPTRMVGDFFSLVSPIGFPGVPGLFGSRLRQVSANHRFRRSGSILSERAVHQLSAFVAPAIQTPNRFNL
jgi:hypothetical protein